MGKNTNLWRRPDAQRLRDSRIETLKHWDETLRTKTILPDLVLMRAGPQTKIRENVWSKWKRKTKREIFWRCRLSL